MTRATGRQDQAERSYSADVVVVGGGPAGAWTAIAAARSGAEVILVDKGYLGSSGVTATAGTNLWLIPPDDELRDEAMDRRERIGGGLVDRGWMRRLIEQTWETLPQLRGVYAFPSDDDGVERRHSLRGPEYGRAFRRLVVRAGVRVLDHSPALELLAHSDGSIAGIAGVHRQPITGFPDATSPGMSYSIHTGAVVLATGGCAFKSHLLGCHTDTGDGHLMAHEAGAELSGMELSCYYTLAPARSTMTRSMSYLFGTFFDSDGNELQLSPDPAVRNEQIARAVVAGPLYTRLDKMPHEVRDRMRSVQPNFMLPFDRAGINPYSDLFEVTLRPEGTIRGVGGLRIATDECMTSIPGLFVAGDVASRELVAGAVSGGGSVNSAWAMSSGTWAGRGAARYARSAGRSGKRSTAPGDTRPLGQAGLRPSDSVEHVDLRSLVRAVQAEVHPLEKNYFRTETTMRRALAELDDLWAMVSRHVRGSGLDLVRGREAAAMVAHGRWTYTAACARVESRGMHRRVDAPTSDPAYARRLAAGGLDKPWAAFQDVPTPLAPLRVIDGLTPDSPADMPVLEGQSS